MALVLEGMFDFVCLLYQYGYWEGWGGGDGGDVEYREWEV